MPLRPTRDVQDGFAGGINTSADVLALQPSEFRQGTNARLSVRGSVGKRGGTQEVSASPIAAYAVKGGYSFRTATTTTELAVVNGTLYTGTLGTPMTWASKAGSLSTTAIPSFASFRGPSADGVYIADGGLLNFWDGTTLTTNIASTPAVDIVCAWGPRLFALSATNPETLYWSSTTGGINGSTLGATLGGGSAIVRTYGGQRLTALAPLRSSLLIFHAQAISRFTGMTTDDINIAAGTQGITNDVGTIAPRSIVVVENAAYFLSDRGVFACSEADVVPVASPIEQTLAALGKSDWAQVSAVHARGKNEIWFTLPNVGVYVYNYRTGGWAGPWTGAYVTPQVHTMWDTRDSDGRNVILAGCADGHVLWCDKETLWVDRAASSGAGGASYTMTVQMRRFFAGDFTAQKTWRDVYFLGTFPSVSNTQMRMTSSSGETTVAFPVSGANDGGMTWGDSAYVWGSGWVWASSTPAQDRTVVLPIGGTHSWIDIAFDDSAPNDARISQVIVVGFPRGRR